jgi:hypothetical protein
MNTYHTLRETTGHWPPTTGRCFRHGLASLELVLALPILLFMMALMVNFGVIAAWKVRGSSVSRFEAWRARDERTNYTYPRDDSWWPNAATYAYGWDGNITVSSSLTGAVDSSSMVPTGDVTVVATLLDVTRGLVRGYAELSRGYAMLGKMGKFEVQAQTYLVDDKWRYDEMGLGRNNARRSLVVYHLPTASSAAYVQAATNLFYAFYYNPPYTAYLAPLDRDPEFIAFRGFAPHFPPPLASFCTLDMSVVDALVQNLIDQVQGVYGEQIHIPSVAEQMTQAFISLYQQMVQNYQNQINAAKNNPNSQVDTAALQADIATLNQEIATLQAFLAKLQNSNGS